MELALALEGARGVHDFDGDGEAGGEEGLVDGAEAAVAKAVGGGKRRRGAAEEGVGESAAGVFLVGFGGGGPVARKFPVDKENGYEENEERSGQGCGQDDKKTAWPVAVVVVVAGG